MSARPRKALRLERLFYCLLAGLSWALPQGAWAAPACGADRFDRVARVAHVYDGDTVRLATGEKLRLIGFDTPELDRAGQAAQPLAVAARNRLQALLLANGNVLKLRADRRPTDAYKRLLAHGFLSDGQSLASLMLSEGLATLIPVPPNVWNLACYADAEAGARRAGKGVWRHAAWRAVDSRKLDRRARGYRMVKGRVTHVGHGRKSLWLNLPGQVSLRIPRENLGYFRELDGATLDSAKREPAKLAGRTVVGRGRIYAAKGKLSMDIRHPAVLEVLP